MSKNKIRKPAKTLTAFFLCLLLSLTGAEMFSLSALAENPTLEDQLSSFLNEIIDTQDAVELYNPEETADHELALLMNDGTISVYSFSEPIKFEDENGEVKFKDTTIVEQTDAKAEQEGFAFTNGDNEFSIGFSEDVENGIKVGDTKNELTLTPVQAEDASGVSGEATQVTNKDNVTESVFAYENVFGEGSRIEYSPQLNGLKENIILEQYTGQNTFEFILNTHGNVAELMENQSIKIRDRKSGKALHTLTPLFAYDSYDDGEYSTDPRHYTEDCRYTLSEQNDGTYKLTVTVSEEWLTAPTTVYPVTIDPTLTNNYTGMDTALYSKNPDTVYNNATNNTGYSSTYGKGRVMFKFAMPSAIPTGAEITAAQYYFRETTAKADSTHVGAHMINSGASGWTSAQATWNKYAAGYDAAQLSRKEINSQSTDVSGSNYWYKFDIKTAVQKWINGTNANRGIMLVSESEGSSASWRAWASIRHGTSSYKPYCNIIYEPDTERPVINSVTGNPTSWTNQNVTLTVNASDNVGVKEYSFDNGSTWQTGKTKAYTANTSNIKIKVRDYAGNESTPATTISITKIDKNKPGKPSSVTVSPTAWTNGNITVTHTAASSNLPITKYQYAISTSSTKAPTAFADLPSPTALSHIVTAPSEGTQYVWVRAVNVVGGGEAKCSGTPYKRDAVKPNIPTTLSLEPDPAISGNKKLTWSGVTDSLSGVEKLEYKLPNGSYTLIPSSAGIASGSYSFDCPPNVTSVTFKSTDNAGNFRTTPVSPSPTPIDVLTAPENFVAKGMVSMSTRLTWDGDDSADVTYDIYASSTSGGAYTKIAQDVTGSYWFDYTLRTGTRYYKVKAKAVINGQPEESPFTPVQSADSVSVAIADSHIGIRAHEQLLSFAIDGGAGMVHPISGNLYYGDTDASTNSAAEPVEFTRSYNSLGAYDTGLGSNWDHSLNIMLLKQVDANGNETGMLYKAGDGSLNLFTKNGNGGYTRPDGLYAWLTQESNGNYTLTFKDETKYYFNAFNQLEEIQTRFGQSTMFTYRADGNLIQVINPVGDELTIEYLTQTGKTDIIKSVKAAGVTTYYEYDNSGRLTEVYKENGEKQISEQYVYTNGKLTGIINANAQEYTISYNSDKVSAVMNPENQMHSIAYSRDVNQNYLVTGSFQGKVIQQRYTPDMGLFAISENGRVTGYVLDADYNVTQTTTPGQKVLQSTYDSRGNLLTTTEPGNLVTYYTYDQGRDVPKRVDAPFDGNLRQVTVNTYDSNDQLLTTYLEGGRKKTFNAYDVNRNLIQTVEVTGDGAEALTAYMQAVGSGYYVQETQYTYDDKGCLTLTTQIGENFNRETTQLYDEETNQLLEENDGEIESEFKYDEIGQMVESTTTDSEEMIHVTQETEYDPMGNVVVRTSPLGEVTTEYDALGRVIRTVDESGLITETAHTEKPDGSTYTVTTQSKDDVVQNKSLSVQDQWGNDILSGTVAINEESGVRTEEGLELLFYTENTYDADGKVTEVLNSAGITTLSTYDARDRLISQTTSKGNESETIASTYNDGGSLLTETAADGKVTAYEYDIAGNVLSTIVSKDNNSLCIEAAEHDQVVNGKHLYTDFDAKERPISRYSDSLGDLTQETIGTKTLAYTYNTNGQMLNSTLTDTAYPNESTVTAYEYTGIRNTRKTYAPGHYVDYTYDNEMGFLLSETVTKGLWSHTTSYTYDSATGKVLTTTRNGDTTAYTYTPTGSMETITYATGDIVSYDYDSEGQVVLIRHNDVPLQRYEYNSEGQLVTVKNYDTFGDEYVIKSYAYDWKGALTNKTYYDLFGLENEQYDLTYENDKIVNETKTQLGIYSGSPLISEKEYEYDWLDRMVTETVDEETTEYTYDEVSNRLSMSDGNDVHAYTYNDADQLLDSKENNVTTKSYTYDLNGNQISDGGSRDYVFDAANQLEKVMDGASVVAEYTYDANGQRLSKTADNQTTEYYYDGINLLYIKEDDQLSDVFLRGLGGDIVMGIRDDYYYSYHTDPRGSITNILNEWGGVYQRTAYDAYGNITDEYDSFGSSLGYTGAVMDRETGLLYLSARYYDPETSRFISEDPARDGQSWYMYCKGDPVNHIDPTGLKPLTKNGSTGSYVKEIQRRMNAIKIRDGNGNPLTVDGKFGPKTETAVKKFQSINGLVVDGKVGNNTWGLIDKKISLFNCFGYALNTFIIWQPAGINWSNYPVEALQDAMEKQLGKGKVNGIKSKDTSISKNEYRVAIRVARRPDKSLIDAHIMKQDSQGWGYWSEKHGTRGDMKYYNCYVNPNIWNGFFGNDSDYNYNSETLYLAVKFTRK